MIEPSDATSIARRRLLQFAAAATAGTVGAPPGAHAANREAAETGQASTGARAPPSRRPATAAPPVPQGDPAFDVLTLGKLQGDLSGATTWIYNPGCVYGVIPGQGLPPAEFARPLFRVEGVTRRISRRVPDGSVEERSRNWMFYCDADSSEYLSRLRNPWTGELLEVPPWRGVPTRSRLTVQGLVADFGPGFENTAVGQPPRLHWRTLGDTTWVGRQASTRIPGAGGALRNEMSIDAWVCRTRDVTDARLTHIPSTYAWTSFAEWMAWLKMGTRPGNLIWRIESSVLHERDALPARFLERMQKMLPGKLDEPMNWDS